MNRLDGIVPFPVSKVLNLERVVLAPLPKDVKTVAGRHEHPAAAVRLILQGDDALDQNEQFLEVIGPVVAQLLGPAGLAQALKIEGHCGQSSPFLRRRSSGETARHSGQRIPASGPSLSSIARSIAVFAICASCRVSLGGSSRLAIRRNSLAIQLFIRIDVVEGTPAPLDAVLDDETPVAHPRLEGGTDDAGPLVAAFLPDQRADDVGHLSTMAIRGLISFCAMIMSATAFGVVGSVVVFVMMAQIAEVTAKLFWVDESL